MPFDLSHDVATLPGQQKGICNLWVDADAIRHLDVTEINTSIMHNVTICKNILKLKKDFYYLQCICSQNFINLKKILLYIRYLLCYMRPVGV